MQMQFQFSLVCLLSLTWSKSQQAFLVKMTEKIFLKMLIYSILTKTKLLLAIEKKRITEENYSNAGYLAENFERKKPKTQHLITSKF